MFQTVWKVLLLLAIALPTIIVLSENGNRSPMFAFAVEDEVDEGVVDDEGEGVVEDEAVQAPITEEEEDLAEKPLTRSLNANSQILFTQPKDPRVELPAGVEANFLVGFSHNGAPSSSDFILETLDASFRYPMDFNFYIQNFSTIQYLRTVKPTQQVTLSYSFVPNEAFVARPFGLVVNLKYRDSEGNQFVDAVFNETVTVTEVDEGLDGETFFLYIFLAAGAVLILVAGQQFLANFARKKQGGSKAKKQVETGTNNHNGVDFDWLPQGVLKNHINKGNDAKTSPPNSRKVRRPAGSDE